MKKSAAALLLSLTLALSTAAPVKAADLKCAKVQVDGVTSTTCEAYLHGWTSYVSFYYGTLALRPDAQVLWENGQYVARGEDFTMTARVGDPYLVVNGRYLYIEGLVKDAGDGMAWVPLRTLCTALGSSVTWQGDQLLVTTGTTPLKEADRPYDDATLELLASVITHESGNQPLQGKMAVGNVILNRVNSPSFPNTVSEVIYQKNQFPGAAGGRVNEDSRLAARLVLEGANVVPGAFWFNGAGKSCWASRNKTLIATIGGHSFYG